MEKKLQNIEDLKINLILNENIDFEKENIKIIKKGILILPEFNLIINSFIIGSSHIIQLSKIDTKEVLLNEIIADYIYNNENHNEKVLYKEINLNKQIENIKIKENFENIENYQVKLKFIKNYNYFDSENENYMEVNKNLKDNIIKIKSFKNSKLNLNHYFMNFKLLNAETCIKIKRKDNKITIFTLHIYPNNEYSLKTKTTFFLK